MVHLVGFNIETYHDTRPYKRKKKRTTLFLKFLSSVQLVLILILHDLLIYLFVFSLYGSF